MPRRIEMHPFESYMDGLFIFGSYKPTFQKDYLEFLVSTKADKTKLLPVLLEISISDPTYKSQLKEVYSQGDASTNDFYRFWLDTVNSTAEEVSPIELVTLNKVKFNTSDHLGKWILIDFWGTWCAPCRAEHPELESLFRSSSAKKPQNLTILTIACNDSPQKVTSYMKKAQFTFPVAMANANIQNTYNIQEYPTKLLITPQGKYIHIPPSKDWVKYVKAYVDL